MANKNEEIYSLRLKRLVGVELQLFHHTENRNKNMLEKPNHLRTKIKENLK